MTTKASRFSRPKRSNAVVSSQAPRARPGSTSEVVPASSRMRGEHEMKLAALQDALEEGEQSPVDENFSLDRVLSRLRNTAR